MKERGRLGTKAEEHTTGAGSVLEAHSSTGARCRSVAARYDDLIYRPIFSEYFANSDFMNYGYWEENTADQKEACENLMEQLLALIPDKSGIILDVACGKGATTRYLTKYFSPEKVTGINISERQIETARTNAPGCAFLLMDAASLGFDDDSFDNIICVEAAFHFNTRLKFFREAYRVLKPGGRLVLSDILMSQAAERDRPHRIKENYVKGRREYSDLLRSVGMRQVEVIDATGSCWRGHFRNVVGYLHEKFLSKEITREQLEAYMAPTYGRVFDTEHYFLAMGEKN